MSIVRTRIEKQVGDALPRQVFRQRRHAVGEDQPAGIELLGSNASRRRLLSAVGLFRESQSTLFSTRLSNPHQAIEGLRRYLVVAVEAAEYETRGRQTEIFAREYGRSR